MSFVPIELAEEKKTGFIPIEETGKPLLPEPVPTGNILLDTIQGTARETAPAALGFLNNLTGGLLGFKLRQEGFDLPEAETIAGS